MHVDGRNPQPSGLVPSGRPPDQTDMLGIAAEDADVRPHSHGLRPDGGVNALLDEDGRDRDHQEPRRRLRVHVATVDLRSWRPIETACSWLEALPAQSAPSDLQGARHRLGPMNGPDTRTSLPSRKNLSNRGSEPLRSRMRFKVLGPLHVTGAQ